MVKKKKINTTSKKGKNTKILHELAAAQSKFVSLERLTNLFENAPAFICTLRGKHHVFELANKQYYQLVGHRDILGKPALLAIPEAKEQGFIKSLDTVFKTGKPFVGNEVKIALQRAAHTPLEDRYVNFVFQPIFESDDRISGIFVHGVDVTEQVLARRKLEESEERFRTMTDNIPNLAWMANPDGYIFWYNLRWFEYTGTTAQEMEGWGWQKVHDPESLQKVLVEWKKSIKSKKEFEMVFPIRGADGQFRSFLTRVVPVLDKAGKVARWFGTNTDIAEQKKVEESLKESESRIRFMADAMPQQVWSATPDGALDYVNQYTVTYFNKRAEDIIGAGWQSVIHPDDLPNCIDSWTESLKTGKQYQVFFRLQKYDGTYRWHLGRALPLFDEQKVLKWFGTNTDIDDQKKLEAQKDDFLGIASHELKTPVTSIKAYGQVLEATFRRKGDLQAADQLLKMDAQINRLSNLIADLLDVTKIQSGRIQFHQEYFDFNMLVKDTVEEMQRTTEKHSIGLKLGKIKNVFADKERIEQVLTNFITNAIKYSPRANKINVTSAVASGSVTLRVQDFGVGIQKENQQKVFEQFYRVSGPKQDTFPGLGLGLYISSEIIKREGGKIWVESAVGKGSTFCFSLPLQKKNTRQHITTLAHEEIPHDK